MRDARPSSAHEHEAEQRAGRADRRIEALRARLRSSGWLAHVDGMRHERDCSSLGRDRKDKALSRGRGANSGDAALDKLLQSRPPWMKWGIH